IINNAEYNFSDLKSTLKVKYFIDRLLVYPAIFLACPFIFIAAWILKLEGWLNPENKGKIFYSETRISEGKEFKLFKFRTVSSKELEWIKKRPSSRSITFNLKRTPAGQVIIKWYLDELPQLFNILKGEMSFVGPRPHIKRELDQELREGCFYRNIMRAGLFGVPQACKNNRKHVFLFKEMSSNYKAKPKILNTLDGVYAKECIRRSTIGVLLLDFVIISRFILILIAGKGLFSVEYPD
ncbi:MAG: sugar transferase, partial [Candidatus Omnitrophica bacterium]|nr:sugar transferase [Candidatus Omnitrophota bacterium]